MRIIRYILCAVILLPLSLQAEALLMHTEALQPSTEFEHLWTNEDAEHIAKVLYYECRGASKTEQAAVVWVILNRVDSEDSYYPDTIIEVVKQKSQFAYKSKTQILDELKEIAVDVLNRWESEKNFTKDIDISEIGRVIPSDYLYFTGDGKQNYFRNSYAKPYTIWDWSLPSPYEDIND